MLTFTLSKNNIFEKYSAFNFKPNFQYFETRNPAEIIFWAKSEAVYEVNRHTEKPSLKPIYYATPLY